MSHISVTFQSTFCSLSINPDASSGRQEQPIVLYPRVTALTVNQLYADSQSAKHNTLFKLVFSFQTSRGGMFCSLTHRSQQSRNRRYSRDGRCCCAVNWLPVTRLTRARIHWSDVIQRWRCHREPFNASKVLSVLKVSILPLSTGTRKIGLDFPS